MAAPLEVAVGVDESKAVAGIKKLGQAVEDVSKDFDKLGKDSNFDKMAKEADSAGKKIKKDLTEPLKQVKQEAGQSGREAAASFSGGFDDIQDLVQETAANAFSGFGPVGAAAGLVVAGIIGAAVAGAQDAQEKLNTAREAAVELSRTMYENGGELPLTDRVQELFDILGRESSANGPLQKLINDYVDFGTVLDDVKDSAQQMGQPVEKLMQSLTGTNLDATKDSLKQVTDQIKQMRDARGGWVPVWDEEYQSLKSVQTELQGVVTQTELAGELYNSTEFLNTQRVDALAEAWRNAAGSVSGFFQTGQEGMSGAIFNVEAYVAAQEGLAAAAASAQANILLVPEEIQAEAERIWAEQGPVAADLYISGYQNADAGMRGRLSAIAQGQGETGGRALAEGFVNAADRGIRGWTPPEKAGTIRVRLDTSAYDSWQPSAKYGVVYNMPGGNVDAF